MKKSLVLACTLALSAGLALTACAPGNQPATSPPATTSGNSSPSSATTAAATPSPTQQAVQVFGYEFPFGALPTKLVKEGLPARVGATVAVPSTPGPHPVVFILHGSYANCIWLEKDKLFTKPLNTLQAPEVCPAKNSSNEQMTGGPTYVRWDAAFGLMAQQIAARGMVAVAIDVAAVDDLSYGEPTPLEDNAKLVEIHRKLLADFNEGRNHGLDLPAAMKGSMDLDKVAMVGHSSRGGFLGEYLQDSKTKLAATVLLQPAFNSPVDQPFPHPAPMLVLAGQCDEQANPETVKQEAAAVAKLNTGAPTILGEMAATTHIAMVGGGNHKLGSVTPVESAACADKSIAPAADSRGAAATTVASFLAQAFDGAKTFTLPTSEKLATTYQAVTGDPVKTTTEQLPADLPAASITYLEGADMILPKFTGKRNAEGSGD